jgi:hypothetical protein
VSNPVHIINLNETSVVRLAITVAMGRSFAIFAVDPILPVRCHPLYVVARWARRRPGYVKTNECAVWVQTMKQDPNFFFRQDLYAEVEPWMQRWFAFDRWDVHQSPYTRPFKKLVSGWVNDHFSTVHAIRDAMDRFGPEACRVYGFSRDFTELFRAVFGQHPGGQRFVTRPTYLMNIIVSLIGVAIGLCGAASRLRLRTSPAEDILFGADFIADQSYRGLLDNVLDSPDQALVVLRSAAQSGQQREMLKRYRAVQSGAGKFSATAGIAAMAYILSCSLRLFFQHRLRDPSVFFQVAILPYRRLVWRSLFARYRFRTFLARDPYNVEHIIRTQELRRIGANSLGLMHALPSFARRLSIWRYLEFDTFYVFGDGIKKHYADTWPEEMDVRAVGGFRSPQKSPADILVDRSSDIAVFAVPTLDAPYMIDLVRRLADAFPDRQIHLKVKPGYHYLDTDRQYREAFDGPTGNVVVSDEDSYELMGRVCYVISNPSSVIAEAIYAGAYSFAFDAPGIVKSLYFRDFPELCLHTPDQAIDRISAIDRGHEIYQREKFLPLIRFDCPSLIDTLRADLALANHTSDATVAQAYEKEQTV